MSPTVLVTLAESAGTPSATRVGNVIREPAPASAFAAPAPIPAAAAAAASATFKRAATTARSYPLRPPGAARRESRSRARCAGDRHECLRGGPRSRARAPRRVRRPRDRPAGAGSPHGRGASARARRRLVPELPWRAATPRGGIQPRAARVTAASAPRPRLARDLVAHVPGEMPGRANPQSPGDEQALHYIDPIWHVGPNAPVEAF